MSKHIHADLMMQYAQDAMTTDKPWELWEYYDGYDYEMPPREEDRWHTCARNHFFGSKGKYRRKLLTININGFDVPEPVREEPELNQAYYYLLLLADEVTHKGIWKDNSYDFNRLVKGLVHLTKEAAELHAKALLSFTRTKS